MHALEIKSSDRHKNNGTTNTILKKKMYFYDLPLKIKRSFEVHTR